MKTLLKITISSIFIFFSIVSLAQPIEFKIYSDVETYIKERDVNWSVFRNNFDYYSKLGYVVLTNSNDFDEEIKRIYINLSNGENVLLENANGQNDFEYIFGHKYSPVRDEWGARVADPKILKNLLKTYKVTCVDLVTNSGSVRHVIADSEVFIKYVKYESR